MKISVSLTLPSFKSGKLYETIPNSSKMGPHIDNNMYASAFAKLYF